MKTPTFQTKQVSRQRLWQIKQRELGNCTCCAKPAAGKRFCPECDEKVAKRAGIKTRYTPKEEWAKVDWTRSNLDIAQEFGVTYNAVYFQRIKCGSAAPRAQTRWDSVDWKQSNSQISRKLCVTLAAVRYQRFKRTGQSS